MRIENLYIDQGDIDKIKELSKRPIDCDGQDVLESAMFWRNHTLGHNYKVTIIAKKITKTPLGDWVKRKWNHFVRLFLI